MDVTSVNLYKQTQKYQVNEMTFDGWFTVTMGSYGKYEKWRNKQQKDKLHQHVKLPPSITHRYSDNECNDVKARTTFELSYRFGLAKIQ